MSFEDDSPIVRFLAAVVVVTVALMPGSTGATKPTPLPPGPRASRRVRRSSSVTPPPHGSVVGDPRDCTARRRRSTGCAGSRSRSRIATISTSGHFAAGDPYVDCNGNGRWDGILLGGGADTPRFASTVADDVHARALVVSNHRQADRGRGARPRGCVQRLSGAHPRQGGGRRLPPRQHLHLRDARRIGARHARHLGSSTSSPPVSTRTTSTSSSRGRPRRSKNAYNRTASGASQVRRSDRAREPSPVLVVVSVRRRSADARAPGGRDQRDRDRDARRCQPTRRDARLQPRSANSAPGSAPTGRTSSAPRSRQRYGGVAIEMAGSVGSNETPRGVQRPDLARAAAVRRRVTSRRLPHARSTPTARKRLSATPKRRRCSVGNSAPRSATRWTTREPGRSQTTSGAHATTCASRSRMCSSRSVRSSASSPHARDTATTAPSNIRLRQRRDIGRRAAVASRGLPHR